jgi:electron transfer flavoprotein beta subunit
MPLDVAILLSIGRHPASGRSRRADLDARALELALRLGNSVRLHAIHAGDPQEPALADYLGMGLATLTVLKQPRDADVLPALADHLAGLKPGLILAGKAVISEAAACLLAHELRAPYCRDRRSRLRRRVGALQALPATRRRVVAGLPALPPSTGRPAGRQSAPSPGRGPASSSSSCPGLGGQTPASGCPRPKPKRLKVATGGSAAERLRAATEMQAGRGQLLLNPPAEEAARAIFDYLVKEGILSPATLVAPDASG